MHRGEFPVGHHQRCPAATHFQSRFLQFSRPPEGLGVGTAAALADHSNRPSPCTAHQPLQFCQLPVTAQGVSTGEGEQQHRFLRAVGLPGRGFIAFAVRAPEPLLAKIPQIAPSQRTPALGFLLIRLQQFRKPQAVCTGVGCKAKPVARGNVEGHHRIGASFLEAMALERTTHQSPAATAATWGLGKVVLEA